MSDAAIDSGKPLAFLGRIEGLNQTDRRKSLRKRLFASLGALVLLGAVGAGAWWFWLGQRYVSTDDAYVDATSAQITPQVDGTIAAVPVNDTMHVKRGQVLIQLDRADTTIAFAQAEANYAQAVRHVRQYFANSDEAAATVQARASDMERAKLDYDRRAALFAARAISAEQLSNARNALETARAGHVASEQALQAQQALIHGVDVDHNPEVLAAKAALDKASLDLSRTAIRAPFDGVVAQNRAQIGQRVHVGDVLMSVVPIDHAYVDANFKEGQLTRVHSGQDVTLTSDLYGSGVVFHGKVEGLSGGTGSAFAVIPAQNATGNWIKVVQRLPVRIALESRELEEHPLRVGLSMNAEIDVAQ
jgi:membrane fusion protein (multidrug efflux system)